MADLNLKAGTNMSIRQEDTDLYLDNTYEYDDTQIQQDLLTRSLITETGKTIELTLNTTTYKMTAILKDKYGNVISTSNEIDLPIESLVVSIYYDSTTKELVFVLKDGTTTRVPLLDLIDGLATEEDLQTLEDNVNETIQSFEDDINEDMETFKGDVQQELEKAQQDLSMYKMLENALPKVEGEGESITLDNTAKCPMKLGFKGQIQQNSTTGKNLLDTSLLPITDNGITINQNDNGDIVINGTPTYSDGYKTFTIGVPKTIEANTYTMSVANKKDGLGINIGGFGGSLNLTMADVNTSKSSTSTQAYEIKAQINIMYNAGSFNNYIFNPMLEIGSSKTSYEPYTGGATPRPDYPRDIHIVSGDNEIKVCNKNLFDKNSEDVGYVYSSTGSYSASALWNTSDWISVESNSQYTLSFKTTGTSNLFFSEFDKNKTFIQRTSTSPITPQSNTKYIRLSYKNDIGTYDIQIEKGNQATDYVEHQEYTKEINLGVKNLWDNQSTGWLPQSGSYPTTNSTYPNARYILVDLLKGQSITLSGSTSNLGRVRYIDKDTNQVVGMINNGETEYYKSTGTYVGQFTEGTITAKKGFIVGIMDMGGSVNDLVVNYGTRPSTISDTPIELCKIGEYEDEFFKNTIDSEYYDSTLEQDKWYLKKRIGKVVLDGSEEWGLANNVFYKSNNKGLQQNGIKIVKSNYFQEAYNQPSTSNVNTYNSDNSICGSSVGTNRFYIKCTSITSTENFKTWLSTHNTIVYYVLATPQNILLNGTLQETLDSFYSWQEQTNISQENNDLPFVIKASAIYDLSNLVNRVATLETE